MTKPNDLREFIERRDRLFRNATLENALVFMPPPPGGHLNPLAPLAALHKARLQWLDATDAMLAESKKWLEDNGYASSWKGVPPMTPQRRDIERMMHGKLPLSGRTAGFEK